MTKKTVMGELKLQSIDLRGTLKIEFSTRSINVRYCFFFPLFSVKPIIRGTLKVAECRTIRTPFAEPDKYVIYN